MKQFTVLLAMLVCGCAEVHEETVVNDGAVARIMYKGGAAHGWMVCSFENGSQRWVLHYNDQTMVALGVNASGDVSSCSYEDKDYNIIRKEFAPGEPLGSRTLDILEEVKAEAARRGIPFPQKSVALVSD